MVENKVQKADLALRAKTFRYVLGIFVLAMLVKHLLVGYLEGAGDDMELLIARTYHAVYILAFAALPAIYFSYYLWRLARLTLAQSRFPPNDTLVIKDTVIRQGQAARRLAYVLATFSILLGSAFIVLPMLVYFVLNAMVAHA